MPDQRTITVLGVLLVAMTLTSSLLLLLEPSPVAPVQAVAMRLDTSSAGDEAAALDEALLEVAEPAQWQAIIIHDSGSAAGSAEAINRDHERDGRGGLGYHFVIGNGTGTGDGHIEAGFRWRLQSQGRFLAGAEADRWHRIAIGIVVVGDADRAPLTADQQEALVDLVAAIQNRFGIRSERVFLHLGDEGAGGLTGLSDARLRSDLDARLTR